MPPLVPPLAEVFATIPDFRHARGKRHPLKAMLMRACVAMLAGARGQSGIADWAKNYGEPWRTRLGFTHAKGPSQSTVQRVFAGVGGSTQPRDWAATARWSDEYRRCLSSFRRATRLSPRRGRPCVPTMNKPCPPATP